MPPASNSSLIADLEKVLIDATEIDQRLQALGQEISQHYQDKELTVISVINGAIIFTADLIRQIRIPLILESLRVSSYQNSCAPQTEPALFDAVTLELKGSHVLIIDDILDSGRTLSAIIQHLQSKAACKPENLCTTGQNVSQRLPYDSRLCRLQNYWTLLLWVMVSTMRSAIDSFPALAFSNQNVTKLLSISSQS